VLSLRFFVPRNTFQAKSLEAQLRLPPFHECSPPVHSDAPRLKVELEGSWQIITLTAHSLDGFETPAVRTFLDRAVAAALAESAEPKGKLKKASEL
jgi:hypothetical protein